MTTTTSPSRTSRRRRVFLRHLLSLALPAFFREVLGTDHVREAPEYGCLSLWASHAILWEARLKNKGRGGSLSKSNLSQVKRFFTETAIPPFRQVGIHESCRSCKSNDSSQKPPFRQVGNAAPMMNRSWKLRKYGTRSSDHLHFMEHGIGRIPSSSTGISRYRHPVSDRYWMSSGTGISRYRHPVSDRYWMSSGTGISRYRHPVSDRYWMSSGTGISRYRHPVSDRCWKHPVPHQNSSLIRYPSSRTGWRYRVLDTGKKMTVSADTGTG